VKLDGFFHDEYLVAGLKREAAPQLRRTSAGWLILLFDETDRFSLYLRLLHHLLETDQYIRARNIQPATARFIRPMTAVGQNWLMRR
jgi:hypothetical protein